MLKPRHILKWLSIFDVHLLLLSRSYQKSFFERSVEYYPENGERVFVYVGPVKMWENIESLRAMDRALRTTDSVNPDSVLFWFSQFYSDWCVISPEMTEGLTEQEAKDIIALSGINCSDGEYISFQHIHFLVSKIQREIQ